MDTTTLDPTAPAATPETPCACHDAAHKEARMMWVRSIATTVLLVLLVILVLKSIFK